MIYKRRPIWASQKIKSILDMDSEMEKYKNKYRIPSTRLQSWDYGWNGSYFITICTANREHFFGEIVETPNLDVSTINKMQLSQIGKIVNKFWHEIPNHFSFVKLDAFVIMPDHIHGIIIIDKNDATVVGTPNLGVPTNTNTNNTKQKTGGKNPKWKSGTLGSIINQYKRICTINARKINPDFGWQSRFYDHIIRNEKSYNNISKYIVNNPLNLDK